MNSISKLLAICCIAVLLAGCEEPTPPSLEAIQEIINQVNQSGKITDEQAEILSKIEGPLYLNGLTSISDKQAESLNNIRSISLNGLTSITDRQARSLSKVENLEISEDLQLLIDKYKKQ